MAKKIKRGDEDWIELSGDEFIEAMKGKSVVMEDGSYNNFLKSQHKDELGLFWYDNIVFNKVVINGDVVIQEGQKSRTIFQHKILIEGGEFVKDFWINGGEFKKITILDSEFKGGFSISDGIFNGDLEIKGGVFKKVVTILGGVFNYQFTISAALFEKNIYLESGMFIGDFRIEGGVFLEKVLIKGGVFESNFKIVGGKFVDTFLIQNGIFKKHFEVYRGEFQESLWFYDGMIDKILLNNTSGFINKIIFTLVNPARVEINKCNVNSIMFNCIIPNSVNVYLQNFTLNQLEFTENFKNEGTFSISQVKATNTIYQSKENEQKPPLKKSSQLSFYKSDMGNAVFLDTLFDSFDKIILHRSKLNNISTSHGHFSLKTKHSKKVYSGIIEKENKLNEYQESYPELAEIYNHLQLAMKKDGNRTWEQKYYAEYMEWHRLAMKEEKNWAQYITLSLNKLSTNYGTSWIRSFLLILILAFVFFFVYVLSLPDITIGFEFFTWSHTQENIAFFSRYYFDFIIPTHKIDFIEGYKAGFWSALIDVFGRIIIGYLIYQTIAAFRQFGKR